jgi:uncharacterized protein
MSAEAKPRTLLLILGYVAGVLLLGALLAPALFFMTQLAMQSAPEGLLAKLLGEKEFPSYFNRAALLAAFIGLVPLLKSLRMSWREVVGDVPLAQGWKQTLGALLLALFFVVLMGFTCFWLEACRLKTEPKWDNWLAPLISGLSVSVIEELLFRGAILGILCRSLGTKAGLWWTTCIFAFLHFLKPPLDGALPASEVTWTSGFWVITQLLRGFGAWENVIGEFLVLAAVGWVLGKTRLVTGGLWVSIGLHAGWVAGMKYFGGIVFTTKALRAGEFTPWMVTNTCRAIVSPIVGVVPLVTILLTGLCALSWLTWQSRRSPQKAIATDKA